MNQAYIKEIMELKKKEEQILSNIKNSWLREQTHDTAIYLNGLFRHADCKPMIYDNAVPEIYVLHSDTTMVLAWYDEYNDTYIDRQAKKRLPFNTDTVLGWCYKSELFPDCSKL